MILLTEVIESREQLNFADYRNGLYTITQMHKHKCMHTHTHANTHTHTHTQTCTQRTIHTNTHTHTGKPYTDTVIYSEFGGGKTDLRGRLKLNAGFD